MERKFASKLSQLKPAAEARKQASTQLRESIQSVTTFNYFYKYFENLLNFSFLLIIKEQIKRD
jgi:hypothetical protein